MVKTLLEIVRAVASELALPVPTAVLSSQDATVNQLRALTVAACDELADMHDWQRLIKTASITTQGGVSQYNLPADYLRVLSNTTWDRTNTRALVGDIAPSSWSSLNNATPGAATRFRIVGNKLTFFPAPGSTPTTVTLDYITRNYAWDVGLGSLKAEFTLDSDLTVYHDRLLINFVKLKFLQEQGMNTMSATENFNASLSSARATDVPAPTISMGPGSGEPLLGADNLAVTGWGQ